MAIVEMKEVIESGLHIGHKKEKWNPQMKPYIYTVQNGFHIMDVIKIMRHINGILDYLRYATKNGATVLFVGTKKEAKPLVPLAANTCNSFYINEKWIGGLLTNWKTFRKLTKKLQLLETQEKSGFLNKLPKKEMARKLKEKDRLHKYFNGIKYMNELPGVVIILGQLEDMNALKECNRLNIRSITLVDTNGDRKMADLFIPGNDDSMSSINFVLGHTVNAIQCGQIEFQEMQERKAKERQTKQSFKKANKKANKTNTSKLSGPSTEKSNMNPAPVQRVEAVSPVVKPVQTKNEKNISLLPRPVRKV